MKTYQLVVNITYDEEVAKANIDKLKDGVKSGEFQRSIKEEEGIEEVKATFKEVKPKKS